jgi:cytochrome c-type biogenesis protein CcmH
MTWIFALGLSALCLAALLFVFKVPRGTWEAAGAALLLGIAGYATQASPGLPGAPKSAAAEVNDAGKALVEARQSLRSAPAQTGNSWLVIADAMVRNGRYADASSILLGAVESNPKDSESWLALAIALVSHAQGNLSPAALHAFRQASAADPAAPGPPFFLGLALAQNGRLDEGRTLWATLLKAAPADAPWRADLQARIASLESFIAQQRAEPERR